MVNQTGAKMVVTFMFALSQVVAGFPEQQSISAMFFTQPPAVASFYGEDCYIEWLMLVGGLHFPKEGLMKSKL